MVSPGPPELANTPPTQSRNPAPGTNGRFFHPGPRGCPRSFRPVPTLPRHLPPPARVRQTAFPPEAPVSVSDVTRGLPLRAVESSGVAQGRMGPG
jgi:hypothetical protein